VSETVLLQFRHRKDPPPSLREAEQELGLNAGLARPEYGVVKIADADKESALYTILVDASVGDQLRAHPDEASESADDADTTVFSNPRIEPFGPPKP
jgi:hypothetical protein